MKTNNPFSLSFGKEPKMLIPTEYQFTEITEMFLSEDPSTSTYLITGVRGSGKTVLLNRIKRFFAEVDGWIVISLNTETDMLESLAAGLYEQVHSKFKLLKKEFSFSFHGLSFSISGERPVSNIQTLLELMLAALKKQNKRLLICADDVVSNANMRIFTKQYQMFLGDEMPVFLIMTGLFENVRSLQNEKSLTFLYRAPRITMAQLDLINIAKAFETSLEVSRQIAVQMAKMTNGYPFAFQVLGFVAFKNNCGDRISEGIIEAFDSYLREYVYEKLFLDLPNGEQKVVMAIAFSDGSSAALREISGFQSNELSQYRDKLIKKGIIKSTARGKTEFLLPRFREFLIGYKDFL